MKLYPSDMFSGGCVFSDHTIVYMSIKHQVVKNATENIKSTLNFDMENQIEGLIINGYHTDNRIFNA